MLSCKEATQLVSQGLDRRLGFFERAALRVHLAICHGCRNFSRQMALLRKAMGRLAD
jgi:predicted anti-sigma-YlaC factor YlaD